MQEPKTKKTRASVTAFLKANTGGESTKDCFAVLDLMKKATGARPAMWGTHIVGFGSYTYKYATGKALDWPVIGFAPRKQNLTLYLPGLGQFEDLTAKLGKHKMTGGGCLYVKSLKDVDIKVLKRLIAESIRYMKALHTVTL